MRRALLRAVAAFRILSLVYAAVLIAHDHGGYRRPGLGWIVLAGMALWTVLISAANERRDTDEVALLVLDLAIAAAAVLLTSAVAYRAAIDHGAPTLPAAWSAAAVMAVAIAGGPWWGGLAGAVVSAADVIERQAVTQHTFNGVVLLMFTGLVGGYIVRLGERAETTLARSTRREAAAAERERLAREIHDSTLQVLALVARRGSELGGEGAELGRLAAEQEVALRTLVSTEQVDGGSVDGVDLRRLIAPLAASSVTLALPGEPVELPPSVAQAIAGAVSEAVTNVARHGGPGAKTWILVEDDAGGVTVSIRDDGVGVDPARLDVARREGRLGVAQSIVGRIEAAGGTAELTSSAGRGTEVVIHVSR
jgi:signal transduction histidine kinase